MAAYAALLSLNHIIEQVLQTTHLLNFLRREQIEALQENVIFLQEFLEQYHPRRREEEEIEKLESKITAAAYKAEEIIESCIADQILGRFAGDDFTLLIWRQVFQIVREEMEFIMIGAMKIKEMEGMKEYQRPRIPTAETSLPRPAPTWKNSMVGFDDDLIEIMDKLTGQRSSLQIILIVGMGGIGKTTLAKSIYDNPFIVQYFHIRWVTISQEYCVRDILIAILREISVHGHGDQLDENLVAFIGKVGEKSDDELGEKLHKCLSGMRYIIAMDDIWSTESWDDIRMFFPDNNNGSRILVTTRLSNLALHFRSCSPYQLDFLDEGKSWTLFCKKVFADEVCPPEMEAIGKKIVKNCRGLPLAIVTIGGLLAKFKMTKKHWEYIRKRYELYGKLGE